MEITDRFPTDATARQAIADDDQAAARVFAALTRDLPAGHTVVANWVKPQFSNGRSYPIRSADGLKFVMEGVLRGHCAQLRFFQEPNSRVPRGDSGGYQALFL